MTTELLAPCGNQDALKAAIASGADAVYLGLSAFNARIKADNFTADGLSETVKYCHIFGVKVYVTINTNIKNSELDEVERAVLLCKDADVDAVIACDLAVLDAVKRLAPKIPVHASTQFGVCNSEGAKFAEKLGFTRVILSREVTLDEIKKIKEETKLEIECFIHGALCVAFSGKCLMSSVINGGSGNRGRCLQPCRLLYSEENSKKEGYLLSTSDLCLAEKLKVLADSGVTSFKIEGRLRRTEYVYKTVSTYRKIIDGNFKVEEGDIEQLKAAYNRGNFSGGYAFSNTQSIMSSKVQGNLGVFVGKIKYVKDGLAYLDGVERLSVGDGYKLFDEKGAEVGGGSIEKVEKGAIKIQNAKQGYSVNLTSEKDFHFDERKLAVSAHYDLDEKGVLSVKYVCKKISVEKSILLESAKAQPLSAETLEGALSKFSDGYFTLSGISGNIFGNFFAARSVLNAFRRECLTELENKILSNYKKSVYPEFDYKSITKNRIIENNLIAVELQNSKQLSHKLVENCDVIIYYPDEYTEKALSEFLRVAKECGAEKVFLKLTVNARENDLRLYEGLLKSVKYDGICAENPYAFSLAQKLSLPVFSGLGMNIFNENQLEILAPDYYLASAELNKGELSKLQNPFVFAYGYMPLMCLSHCVSQLITKKDCSACAYKAPFAYVDRKNYKFRIFRNKAVNCYFTLYNSKITDISSKIINSSFNYYLNMLQCDNEKAATVANAFKSKTALNTADATNGHFLRGVN